MRRSKKQLEILLQLAEDNLHSLRVHTNSNDRRIRALEIENSTLRKQVQALKELLIRERNMTLDQRLQKELRDRDKTIDDLRRGLKALAQGSPSTRLWSPEVPLKDNPK